MPSSTKIVEEKTIIVNKPKLPRLSEREVIYPEVRVDQCCGESSLTNTQAIEIIGWELESDYITRMKAATPGSKDDDFKFDKDDPLVITLDVGSLFVLPEHVKGKKVKLWNNCLNRPYGLRHALKVAQEILTRRWKYNLENIIISRTGIVSDGQHRLTALIIANILWNGPDKYHWQEYWEDEPTIETLIAYGGSEDEDVIRTINNVKARTLGDVIYTSPIFQDLPSPVARAECSRMLDACTTYFWKRTNAGGDYDNFQTHSTSLDLLENHSKLIDSVAHIFRENQDRALSGLKLSAGRCATMLYLMGCSDTMEDDYTLNNPRNETNLNWDQWEKAKTFWVQIATRSPEVDGLIQALGNIIDIDGREVEKFSVICKAWELYKQDIGLTMDELELEYTEPNENGICKLKEVYTVGGIDLGIGKPEEEETLPPAVVEKNTKVEKDKKTEAKKDKPKKETTIKPISHIETGNALVDHISSLRKEHPNRVIFFKGITRYSAYGSDAKIMQDELGLKQSRDHGIPRVDFPLADLEKYVNKINEKYHVALLTKDAQGKDTVVDTVKSKKSTKPGLRGGV